jgi:putative ABC transport system permease protein
VEQLLQDFRYSLRVLRQQPAFTFAAVAALALGIGATTAVFSVVNAVLLKPMPYPLAERIVMFQNTSPQGSGGGSSPAKFAHWSRQTSVIEAPAAFRNVTVNYTGTDTPEQLVSGNVSRNFFRLWGARLQLGRTFSEEEDLPKGPRVAVLSNGWWRTTFASDPGVIGKTILLSGDPYTVTGVLAPGFDPSEFLDPPSVYTAFQLDPNTSDQGHYFRSGARLKPGVTLEQAQAQFKRSADEYRAKYPNALQPTSSFTVQTISTVFVQNSRTLLLVMLAAVAGVLLIACANVANLLLVRSTVRKREIAIRSAMGAERNRIVRQLMTESVLLSSIGAAIGLAIGLLGIRALLSINTAGLPRVGTGGIGVGLDWRLLGFTAAVAIGTGLVFGVMPALQATRLNLSGTLRDGAGASGGGSSHHLRSGLVVLEIALALMLVIGSALLIRTSMALRNVEPGFDATNVLTMSMSFTGPQFQTSAGVDNTIQRGVNRLRTMPGVEVASASCCLPLEGGFGLPFTIQGRALDNGPFHGGAGWATVSPGYFEVFRIKALKGRTFNDQDRAGSTPVVIINESMAKEFWQDSNPVGRMLAIGRGGMREFEAEPIRQIIGVVADSRDGGLNQDPGAKMFVPQGQIPDAVNQLNMRISPLNWVIRTRGEPMAMNAQIQTALRQETGLPVADARSMGQVVARSTSRERFNTLLMSVFALSALALAAIGIYGVMAYAVQQRTREIGVRLALGAQPGAVQRMVVFQGMRLAAAGVVLGVGGAFALSRFMQTLLFGVTVRDPLVFAGVPFLLAAVALVAVWMPAARASRIDPLGAIRAG